MESRREFWRKIFVAGSMLSFSTKSFAKSMPVKKKTEEVRCTLYRAINGTPQENLYKVVELLGGVEKIIGFEDVVVVKPNVQWWNQGAPNLSALKAFVDLIMHRPVVSMGRWLLQRIVTAG